MKVQRRKFGTGPLTRLTNMDLITCNNCRDGDQLILVNYVRIICKACLASSLRANNRCVICWARVNSPMALQPMLDRRTRPRPEKCPPNPALLHLRPQFHSRHHRREGTQPIRNLDAALGNVPTLS